LLETVRDEREQVAEKAALEPNMLRPYRLRPGCKHFLPRDDGTIRRVQPGEVIDLNPSQAEAMPDKFDLVLATEMSVRAGASSGSVGCLQPLVVPRQWD
jgi:hypothetical protein